MPSLQPRLFASPPPGPPEGFVYQPEFISGAEEAELARLLAPLPFEAFEFRGYLGRRRVTSFGWRYDFNQGGLKPAPEFPTWLLPLRDRVAAFAGLEGAALQHALVTEYAPGAGIGWHRDRPQFEDVVGVSLLAPCLFRFRRRRGESWERASLTVQPRSIYLLRGPARRDWEHSVPPVERLRYAVTFRSFRPKWRPSG